MVLSDGAMRLIRRMSRFHFASFNFQFSIFNLSSFPLIPLLAFSLWATPVAATEKKNYDREIARQKQELEDLRARLQSGQKELASLKEKKESTLGRLERISGSIRLTEQYLNRLDATEQTLNASSATIKEELDEIEKRIRERNLIMAKRVRSLYIWGGPDRMVLEGWQSGNGDFLSKVFFMKRVVRYDQSLVDGGRQDAELKRHSAAKLNRSREELNAFRAHKAHEKETFSRAKREQERNLASIQSDESAKQQALKEMEENSKLITDIITALEKRRQEELARNKKATVLESGSKYCLPVEGEVVSKYGLQYHSTLKTTTKNLGIEIRGQPGATVRAAVSGEVALITRIPGYGMGIILDNGSDIFTIYANLAGIHLRQGDKVKTCEEMGTVSVEAGRVYFEVRKGTKTLDPGEWLKSGGK